MRLNRTTVSSHRKSLTYCDKFVLIAGATLLNGFNLHWLFISPINEHKGKKYSTTVPSHRMLSSYLQYTCLIFDRYTTTQPRPLFTLTHIFFNFTAIVTELRSTNIKVSSIALFILKLRL